MLKSAKRVLLQILKGAGVFRLVVKSSWRRQRLAILCWHGIAIDDEHRWDPYLYMPVRDFEARLRLLRDGGYTILGLGEAIDKLYEGRLPERSVALTFDDGFFDFYRQAHPLLKKYGMPATVYLTTYYCDDNRPVFDVMLAYLLWKGRSAGREAAWRMMKEKSANMSASDKDLLLRGLARELGVDYHSIVGRRILHLMNPSEAAELARDGVDIQLHTHRHRTPLDRTLFTREIEDNRRRIEAIAGRTATHFCYPSGIWRQEFLPWLEEARVSSATTCEQDLAAPNHHRLLLPRVLDHARLAPIEVESWLTGAGRLLPRKRTLMRPGA